MTEHPKPDVPTTLESLKVSAAQIQKGGGGVDELRALLQQARAELPRSEADALEAWLGLESCDDGSFEEADPGQADLVIDRARNTPAVLHLIEKERRIRALFSGSSNAKLAIGADGKPIQDTDVGFLLELARRGVENPSELGTALCHRHDGRVSDEWLEEKVRAALAEWDEVQEIRNSATQAGVNFEVGRVVREDSDPPLYRLHIEGKVLRLPIEDLLNQGRFKVRFAALFNRTARVPGNKGGAWDDLVDSWLASAEIEEMPPEANELDLLLLKTIQILDNLQPGESAEDLDRGISVLYRGKGFEYGARAFKSHVVSRALRDDETIGKPPAGSRVPSLLREVGCVYKQVSLGGNKPWVWLMPQAWPHHLADHVPQRIQADGADLADGGDGTGGARGAGGAGGTGGAGGDDHDDGPGGACWPAHDDGAVGGDPAIGTGEDDYVPGDFSDR